jgi:ribosomal protein S18 acetylase RimI-like enzyme
VTAFTDADLYRRGTETLLASWAEYARGAPGAALRRMPGVAAAVFPAGPERGVYNNALLERNLSATDRSCALDATERAYAAAGVPRFAAWVHESERALRTELERRGHSIDTSTRAMGMQLDDLSLIGRPQLDLATLAWDEYLSVFGLPPGLLSGAEHPNLDVRVARLDGEAVATVMAFHLDGDCGIYNVTTLAHARRRGLGTALTATMLHDALERGCRTASLQSTEMAERAYGAVGFRDLGRLLEYVPANVRATGS